MIEQWSTLNSLPLVLSFSYGIIILYQDHRKEEQYMPEIILIRHGEPRYDEVIERGYPNQGYDLGKLTDRGVSQAQQVSKDVRLKQAELIISSPYTRALQTAAIISKNTQIDLVIENDLHEWMPDITFKNEIDPGLAYPEYMKNRGYLPANSAYTYETFDQLKRRVRKAVDKYKDYNKIIVVCHGIVMSTFTKFDDVIEHCGVRVVSYE